MTRSVLVFNLFRVSVLLTTLVGGMLAIVGRYDRASTGQISTTKAFVICIVVVTASLFASGSNSLLYVKLLKWVLRHLHTTEEHRWVIALGITAVCDVFLDTLDMVPFVVLSAVSMITICVVAAGWESDRSGMTEGLLIGFGKLLLIHIISSRLLPSVLCGAVLVLAIASKFTEDTVGDPAEHHPQDGSSGLTHPTVDI